MHRRLVLVWLATAVVPALMRAQAPQPSEPKSPAFEVASVKPNTARTGVRWSRFPGDRFVATNVPLRDLILIAYGEAGQIRPDNQVSSGPSWIDVDRFDVSAKVGANSPNTVAQKQRMLRTLLADRFKLTAHTETRELPIYALVMARRDGTLGPRLRHADLECEAIEGSQPGRRDRCILYALPSGKLMVRGQSMKSLANAFTMLLDRTVEDRTGLTGGVDADADFNPEGLPGMAQVSPDERRLNDAPPFFTALQEQLGLKLDSTKGPVDVLVIDHVERPTPD